MNLPIESLKNCTLLNGLTAVQIQKILPCLSANLVQYPKGASIFEPGQPLTRIACVISGRIHIIQEDYWGRETILTAISKNEIFGESYACLANAPFPFRALAVEDTCLIFFDIYKLLHVCTSACEFHQQIIMNLLNLLSQKNRFLTQRINDVTQRTTREKLLSYLSREAQKQQENCFSIPFNRQQLADYLAIDRSAMTVELGKLQAEGLLAFHKNHFTLLT